MKEDMFGFRKGCHRYLIVFCIFLFAGLLIYWNCLSNPFQYDDDGVVVKNTNIKDVKNIPLFFINPRLSESNPLYAGHYRPIVYASYAVNYAIGGLNPFGYHVVNLAIHIGSAFLIFLIMKAMLEDRKQSAVSSEQIAENKQKLEARSQTTADIQRDKNVPPIDSRGFLTPTFVDSRGFLTPMFVASVASGLIFLVHPFNSEAVNYITARSSIMSGFFYLLGFYCWVLFRSQKQEVRSKIGEDHRGSSNYLNLTSNFLPLASYPLPLTSYFYLFSLLAFIAGMLSKEVVITLPVMLWLYDLYGFKSVSSKQLAVSSKQTEGSNTQCPSESAHRSLLTADYLLNWRNYVLYLPFVLLVAIPYLLMRLFSLGKVLDKFQRDIVTQILTEVPVLFKHWQMFFIPKGFSLVHDVDIFHGMTLLLMVSIVLFILYLVITLYLFLSGSRYLRVVSFSMMWFLIVLLPTTIMPLNAIFQENRGYLAVVSFSLLIGVVLMELGKRVNRTTVISITVILFIIYGVITVKRNFVWGDSIRLWKDAVEIAPGSGIAYAGLSAVYRERGDMFLSIETAKRGLNAEPDNYYLHLNLGRDYFLSGDVDKSIQEYENALRIDPNDAVSMNELATLYVKKGDIEQTEIFLKKAVRKWYSLPPLHYNLGVVLVGRGKLSEAVTEFQEAIAIYPAYLRARYELGEVYEKTGRLDMAREQYNEIIRYGSPDTATVELLYDQDKRIVDRIVSMARQKLGNKQ
ncbi:MAG: tetratricopeptide repeat protein [Nitrospirae bacterium]|nr:tetratricopeptide repeat protein [Nitrospirota bacterium]